MNRPAKWVLELFIDFGYSGIEIITLNVGSYREILSYYKELIYDYAGHESKTTNIHGEVLVFNIEGKGLWGDERGFRIYKLSEVDVNSYINKY